MVRVSARAISGCELAFNMYTGASTSFFILQRMTLLVEHAQLSSNNDPNPNLSLNNWIQGIRNVQSKLVLSPKIDNFDL